MRVVLAAFLLLPTMSAAAQVAPADAARPRVADAGRSVPPVGLLLTGFDVDDDARVTRDELRAGTARAFALADADRSGQVSLIELSSWSATWLGDGSALPGRFDFDRDGSDTVSEKEFAAELSRRFARFDQDNDGVVVRAELLRMAPMRTQPGVGDAGGPVVARPRR